MSADIAAPEVAGCHRYHRQRGVVAVFVSAVLLVLVGFGALAVDLAYGFMVRNEVQNATDAAALAGAACLYRKAECGNLTATEPDWTTAQQRAQAFISQNHAESAALSTGVVETGYWNVTGTPAGLQPTTLASPTVNDVPAVMVTLRKEEDTNGGGARVFFAQIFGIAEMPVATRAVAVRTGPSSTPPGGLFPVAVSKCLYEKYWDISTSSPKLATSTTLDGSDYPQVIGQPWFFDVISTYHAPECDAGQWTTFASIDNDVPAIRNLISNGNPVDVKIDDKVWIQPGTKAAVYKDVNDCSAAGDRSCEYRRVPVVQSVTDTASLSNVVAFACVRIVSASGGSDKQIIMQMSGDTSKCPPEPSSGGGPNYGVVLPPRLTL